MHKLLGLLILTVMLVMAGCNANRYGSSTRTSAADDASPTAMPLIIASALTQRSLIVFAAASLTDAFQELGQNFESANPGVIVQFNFTGSQIARMQIEQGAEADIFASADHKNMDFLVSRSLVAGTSYQDFATNMLVVIMPDKNPAGIQTLNDLARPGLKLILADASVPAGNYARQVLTKMSQNPDFGSDFMTQVLANVVSNETDVRQVVTKVTLGEADAGIVYVSDAVADPDLVEIAIPGEFNVTASYPIAVLANSSDPQLAEAFIKYILSSDGQAILKKWGFGGPPG